MGRAISPWIFQSVLAFVTAGHRPPQKLFLRVPSFPLSAPSGAPPSTLRACRVVRLAINPSSSWSYNYAKSLQSKAYRCAVRTREVWAARSGNLAISAQGTGGRGRHPPRGSPANKRQEASNCLHLCASASFWRDLGLRRDRELAGFISLRNSAEPMELPHGPPPRPDIALDSGPLIGGPFFHSQPFGASVLGQLT